MLTAWLRGLFRWIESRSTGPLRIIAARPLHRGAAIYAAEIDARRLVFAATDHSIALLAAYPAPRPSSAQESGAARVEEPAAPSV